MPLVNDPPKQATAAIPMGRPVIASIAVSAMELSGEVQIILMIPPSRNPIRIGDVVVASETAFPMMASTLVTPGSTKYATPRDRDATTRAPTITFGPSGSFFSIKGATKPMI